ncbi:DNA polymerase III subunit delta' [Nitratiruptor tergarcus]|uniref:DNA polymerase-3 subunit delta n=1 Tax=Nitratiruptor tergarcus DSM 16512 TaxID=1069081 RepID=A0A1W1WT77_9BACT|nr:DNA polymerase III subunit delta' [Nitratiruptor tergarcus]SMC09405.1 DNA polymerase-3 subunit delta' [Nitratiruptor tergarcus DSM 16512]
MFELKSQIIVAQEWEEVKAEFALSLSEEYLHSYFREEFKVEDAKEVIAKAYVASKEPKVMLLAAERYNIYAQNALLKILEEPPHNTVFVIIVRSKTLLLPTILSRLPVVQMQKSEENIEIFRSFDLETLVSLATKYKRATKNETKAIIKNMLQFALKSGFALSKRELAYFGDAMKLIDLNTNPANVIITAGLILLTHKKKKR